MRKRGSYGTLIVFAGLGGPLPTLVLHTMIAFAASRWLCLLSIADRHSFWLSIMWVLFGCKVEADCHMMQMLRAGQRTV